MINQKTYYFAIFQLFCAGVIWGLSFTCVKWGLIDFTTSQLLFWRFLLAFVLGELLMFAFSKKTWKSSHRDIFLSLKPGLFLGFSLIFQIHGLHFTTATNSGFITSLYVVLIPFISLFLFKYQIRWFHFALALLAFAGMGLLLNLQQLDINKGDLLTLGAALTAAFQIIYIGHSAKHSVNAFRYNNYQTFWCLITIIPFLIYESISLEKGFLPQQISILSVTGLLILVFLVSMLAFYLQVSSQKILSTTTASMLCLLEAPFSFLFAALILQEKLIGIQIVGAFLILLSSALSIYVDRPQDGSR